MKYALLLVLWISVWPGRSMDSSVLFKTHTQDIKYLVGTLSLEQEAWLRAHPATYQALRSIAENCKGTDGSCAADIYRHFTTEADPLLSAVLITQEIAFLKIVHPEWSLARMVFIAAWRVTIDQTHTVLDLVGLVPALGEGADFVNGVLYCLEGEGENAAYSFAAMVPFLGWVSTGAKYAGKIVKTAKGSFAELKYVVNSSGLITFGRGQQLQTIIGKKANHQAHHIIPWAHNSHRVVQRAADSGEWHPNLAANGKLLDLTIHRGYTKAHKIYNERIRTELNKLLISGGGDISPQYANLALQTLANKTRKQLDQGKKLDEIQF